MGDIIRDSAEFVLHGGSVACSYDIPDDLCLVDIDKSQMSQVIQNIILNAKHSMPDGGTIRVRCENVDARCSSDVVLPGRGNHIKISISDNGVGIPESIIDKIFDPYFTTKQEGSGLGLAISHAIISKHDGSITVRSIPGEGTAFAIYLPVSARKQEKRAGSEVIARSAAGARVLVMDDEQMIRDVAKEMLEMLGYDVVLARHGQEAIELFKKHHDSGKPVNLAIMDLTIPGGMGGKLAVKEILAINPDAKVVVSSGYSNDPIMAQCREYGFAAAIVKPFELQDIARIVNELMRPDC
jgi:CheY-like chemotaxis protein